MAHKPDPTMYEFYIAAHNERIAAARLVLAEKTDRNYGYLLALYA